MIPSIQISNNQMLSRLELPQGKVRIVLDTDTFNEVDDQFAIAYALLSPEKIQLEAIYAAPFMNALASNPKDGMEKSYEEIFRVLETINYSGKDFVFKGADAFLPECNQPVLSSAVENLIQLAMGTNETPLFVVSIAAPTNVASALLVEPRIAQRIVVVWLGGHPYYWPTAHEFNLMQDLYASKILFDCGVPLINIPCINVSEHLKVTIPEIEAHLKGKSRLGDYLFNLLVDYKIDRLAGSKEIWDIANIAFLINPDWVPTEIVHSPILTDQETYSVDHSRHFIRVATQVKRDPIFRDMFIKFAN